MCLQHSARFQKVMIQQLKCKKSRQLKFKTQNVIWSSPCFIPLRYCRIRITLKYMIISINVCSTFSSKVKNPCTKTVYSVSSYSNYQFRLKVCINEGKEENAAVEDFHNISSILIVPVSGMGVISERDSLKQS